MTPKPGAVNDYPVIIASRLRSMFDYKALDVRLRLRIRARRHGKWAAFSPVDPLDVEACAWIEKLAVRYGRMRWVGASGGAPGTRQGWVKQKSKKDFGVL